MTGCFPDWGNPGLFQLFFGRCFHAPSYVSQPCIFRPVAATNCWNSSTVTALVDMAGRLIITQCSGFSNDAEPLSVTAEPCWKRPAGRTVMPGHDARSRITVPDLGVPALWAQAPAPVPGCRPTIETTAAIVNTAASPTPVARKIESRSKACRV